MIHVFEQNKLARIIIHSEELKAYRIHHPKSGNVEHFGDRFGLWDTEMAAFEALCDFYPHRIFRWETPT